MVHLNANIECHLLRYIKLIYISFAFASLSIKEITFSEAVKSCMCRSSQSSSMESASSFKNFQTIESDNATQKVVKQTKIDFAINWFHYLTAILQAILLPL